MLLSHLYAKNPPRMTRDRRGFLCHLEIVVDSLDEAALRSDNT